MLFTKPVLQTLKLTLSVAVNRQVHKTETAGVNTSFVAILRCTGGMEYRNLNTVIGKV